MRTRDRKWIRDPNRNLYPDGKVRIIGARLKACMEHCDLSGAEMERRTEKVGKRVLGETISKIIDPGRDTSFEGARAIARVLAPEASDPIYLLDWLMDPTAVLSGPTKSEELHPLSTSDQVAAYYRQHEVWLGALLYSTAAAMQSPGPLPPVTLPDGSVMQTYLIKGEDFPPGASQQERGTKS